MTGVVLAFMLGSSYELVKLKEHKETQVHKVQQVLKEHKVFQVLHLVPKVLKVILVKMDQ